MLNIYSHQRNANKDHNERVKWKVSKWKVVKSTERVRWKIFTTPKIREDLDKGWKIIRWSLEPIDHIYFMLRSSKHLLYVVLKISWAMGQLTQRKPYDQLQNSWLNRASIHPILCPKENYLMGLIKKTLNNVVNITVLNKFISK